MEEGVAEESSAIAGVDLQYEDGARGGVNVKANAAQVSKAIVEACMKAIARSVVKAINKEQEMKRRE